MRLSRRTVIEVAREQGRGVREGTVSADAVRGADEVLITSTAGGVMAITSVDGASVGDGTVGPLTRALHDGYWGLHHDPRFATSVDYSDA